MKVLAIIASIVTVLCPHLLRKLIGESELNPLHCFGLGSLYAAKLKEAVTVPIGIPKGDLRREPTMVEKNTALYIVR